MSVFGHGSIPLRKRYEPMTDSVKTAATATKPESLWANLAPQQDSLLRPAPSIPSASSHLITLHRTLGNQAVQRLFQCGAIQPKLTINKPNDIYEQEADRIADKVMRMPEKEVQGNKIESKSRIAQSEIKNPQSAIQLNPG